MKTYMYTQVLAAEIVSKVVRERGGESMCGGEKKLTGQSEAKAASEAKASFSLLADIISTKRR
jgi:hypothetical protein